MIYSVNFSGNSEIPFGIYDLLPGHDGKYRSCVNKGEDDLSCLELYQFGEDWIFSDGKEEWRTSTWREGENNLLYSATNPELILIYTSKFESDQEENFPKTSRFDSLPRDFVFGASGDSSTSSDSCAGWYCCKETSTVVYLSNCQQKDDYVCGSSSSSSGSMIPVACCGLPIPSTLYAHFNTGGFPGCECLAGTVLPIVWNGTVWTATTTGCSATYTFSMTAVCSFGFSGGCSSVLFGATPTSCNPFVTGAVIAVSGCCSGPVLVSITTVP